MIRKRILRIFFVILIIITALGTGKVEAALKSTCDQCNGSLSHSSYRSLT